MKKRSPSNNLNHLSVKELHTHFLAAFGKPTASRNRPWLLKRLQTATAAVKAAPAPVASTESSADRPSTTARDSGLPPGTELRRTWKGNDLVVTVTASGFDLNGTSYRSLSAVATAITGTNWNGHVFFGLKKRAPKRLQAAL